MGNSNTSGNSKCKSDTLCNKEVEKKKAEGKKSEMECDGIHTHTKVLNKLYSTGGDASIDKHLVPTDLVSWAKKYPDYKPPRYTLPFILNTKPVWADPDVTDKEAFSKLKFNELDGPVNRVSFVGRYVVDAEGLPQNPIGRTGLTGRGQLGKWGPNHAADPIVTRWKRDTEGNIMQHSNGKKILEFVAIQRRDTKEWAIPGGMVDANEEVSLTMKREFGEEALNTLEENQKEETKKSIEELFKHGETIYKGYVDDPRNTDNSWMETVASNFHDEDGTTVGRIPLAAGDDAQAVRWLSIDGPLELYASHVYFIEQVCQRRGAFFAASK